MTTRPLFDHVAAKPARRAKSATPTIPVPAKAPPESWRVTFQTAGTGAPGLVRLKRMLKNAYRAHKLKAISVEPMGTIATPCEPAGNQSSESQRGPETAANQAAKTPMRIDTFQEANP